MTAAGQTKLDAAVAAVAACLNVPGPVVRKDIERGAIRSFVAATGNDDPRYDDHSEHSSLSSRAILAPPTFICTIRSSAPIPEIDFGTANINGGNAYELKQDVLSGDAITAQCRLVDVHGKRGRSGDLLVITRETVYTNKCDEIVGTLRTSTIRREAVSDDSGLDVDAVRRSATTGHDGQKLHRVASLRRIPTLRQLVMYAGASGDFNAIHFDSETARRAGLRDVIVHGQLKIAWLAEMLCKWGGRSVRIHTLEASYRGVDYPGVPYVVQASVISHRQIADMALVDLTLSGTPDGGMTTTTGRATVELPVATFERMTERDS